MEAMTSVLLAPGGETSVSASTLKPAAFSAENNFRRTVSSTWAAIERWGYSLIGRGLVDIPTGRVLYRCLNLCRPMVL